MKKICKSLNKCAVLAIAFFTSFWLMSCSESEDVDFELLPDNAAFFYLQPNDLANNDSAAANLAHGIAMMVHPRASYHLSFEKDENAGAPNLQLFRTYIDKGGIRRASRKIRDISPRDVDGRYVYDFICEENDVNYWLATLEKNRDYYTGTVRKVLLEGEGDFSDHLSLNLVVVGDVDLDGFTVEELAHQMLLRFRSSYTSITVDTLHVRYAHEHPTLGNKYPANKPWAAGASSPDMMLYELGGWPGIKNALDLVLAHYIDAPNVLGTSDLFGGQMGSGVYSTLILGSHFISQMGILPLTLDEIVETAIHETGHYFGLRHTTASQADLAYSGDYSNYEDGFDDTPYCPALLQSGLLKVEANIPQAVGDVRYHRAHASAGEWFDADQCPDAGNIMFPMESDVNEGFSEQQLATLRKNLMLFPH